MTKFMELAASTSVRNASMMVALEMIDFQTDSYARDIQVLFNTLGRGLRDGSIRKSEVSRSPAVKTIEELTFKRMGLKIELITNNMLAACIPFYPNPYSAIVPGTYGERGTHFENPFLQHALKDQIKLLDKTNEHKGVVDIKACKVSGFFSEYVNPIFINVNELFRLGANDGEITAIFLHEVGHCFTAFEYSNRLNTTNQVLSQVLKDNLGKTKADKSYVFKELKKINPKTTDAELDKIINGENVILGRSTMRYLEEVIKSQLPNNFYDESGNETLADNFATRWGYGPQIVSGLDKLFHGNKWSPENNLFSASIDSMISIASIYTIIRVSITVIRLFQVMVTGGVLASGFGLALYSFYLLYLSVGFILNHSTYARHMTYDDTKNRYKRVRNQLVEMLKDVTQFSNEQTKEIIKQISLMDDLIDERGKYKNVVKLFIDFLTPGGSDIDDSIKMQRLLESLSASDLYIKAASLRTIA